MSQGDRGLDKYVAALEKLAGGSISQQVHSIDSSALPADSMALPEGDMGHAVSRTRTKTRGLSSRCPTDYEIGPEQSTLAQLLIDGKIYQGALLATAAYKSQDDFRAATGLSNAVLIESKQYDTQVYVSWLEAGTAVFAFRGTESTKDAIADADIRQQPIPFMESMFPGTRGHTGFMKQFCDVTDPQFPERHIGLVLDQMSGGKTPTRVVCCGHSLGGALASLCSAWAAYEYPSADVRCLTLGSPRTGNKVFVHGVTYLVGTMHRVVHSWDPVPAVPPPPAFKHVKGCIVLHKGKCILKSRPWYMSYGLICGTVGDHMLAPYSKGIEAIIGRNLLVDKIGIIVSEEGELVTAPASHDHPASGVAELPVESKSENVTDSAHHSEITPASPYMQPPAGKVEPAARVAPVMRDVGCDPILDGFGNPIDKEADDATPELAEQKPPISAPAVAATAVAS